MQDICVFDSVFKNTLGFDLMAAAWQPEKFEVTMIFLMILKEVSYAHQGFIWSKML